MEREKNCDWVQRQIMTKRLKETRYGVRKKETAIERDEWAKREKIE